MYSSTTRSPDYRIVCGLELRRQRQRFIEKVVQHIVLNLYMKYIPHSPGVYAYKLSIFLIVIIQVKARLGLVLPSGSTFRGSPN